MAVALAVFVAGASSRWGAAGFLMPLAGLAALALTWRPGMALAFAVGLSVLVEPGGQGLVPGADVLYREGPGRLTPADWLLAVALAAVALDALRRRAAVRIPGPLAASSMLVVLAAISGGAVGYAAGVAPVDLLGALRPVLVLVAVPLAVLALELDRATLIRCLVALGGLAVVKAILGLLAVASEGGAATMTFYEPAANWLMLVTVLAVLAMVLRGTRPPFAPAVALGTVLMVASLVLSFRRSFWIAAVLALVVVVLVATSAAGWRLVLPSAALLAVAVAVLSSIDLGTTGSAIAERAESLSPTRIEQNAEDRYRFDERANVLGELRRSPLTGLGVDVPWRATERGLPVEHADGRRYVHMAPLWWWLKLGVLGLVAYAATIGAALLMAWRVWRRGAPGIVRAFGVASVGAVLGLVAIETTASFTGVDDRFTALFAAQLGLLAAASLRAGDHRRPPVRRGA